LDKLSKNNRQKEPLNKGIDKRKNLLLQAMSACVKNGQLLQKDAELLESEERLSTAVALCILAQEEFAKAFLLHLICERIIPWTAKVRGSLHNHKHKQLFGLIMEWLSPTYDEFDTRIAMGAILPEHVADAMKLYVKEVLPQGHISCPPVASNPIAKSIADGNRDKAKQDAFYVRLSEDGEVISIPLQVTPNMVEVELARTERLSNLVKPLLDGPLGQVWDYDLLIETMDFFMLDKRNRPFLLLKESKFGGPLTSLNGTTWSHSISVLIENISDEQAICESGYASVFLNNELVKPLFSSNQFTVDPHTTSIWTFFVSDETFTLGASLLHKLSLYIHFDYIGIHTNYKYHARMWSSYDPGAGIFRETFTDLQESIIVGSPPLGEPETIETKWKRPIKG
jgi:AbiV family abortive infection protein